MFDNYHIDHVI